MNLSKLRDSRWVSGLLILFIFYLLNYHSDNLIKLLFPDFSGYVRWGARMTVEVAGSIAAVMLLYKTWLTGALKEMAVVKPVHKALLLAFAATLPLPLIYGFGSSWATDAGAMELLFFTFLSPVSEEILFRGFAFWMLYRYTNFGFWASALLPAAVFGVEHMAQSQEWMQQLGIVAITGIGSIWFSWLLMRWESLWVPIAFHVLMNFWWTLFDAGATALGDITTIAVRFSTILISILFTIRKEKLPDLLRADKTMSDS
ncbi:MAG TPA: CPBP family intramembrane glutamic endopeptidase [Balneolaceae bacterium]|nr:CPBP family intramembrane glutamic endopeptidase [Balneolaceae bacterium]